MRKVDLITIIVLVVAVGAVLAYRQDRQEKMLSYEPSDYGIPDEIAGYKVLAVNPGYSNPCQPDNEMNVVLTYAAAPQDLDRVHSVLNEINPDIRWQLEIVSAGTREQAIANIKRITEWLAPVGTCMHFSVQPLPTSVYQ